MPTFINKFHFRFRLIHATRAECTGIGWFCLPGFAVHVFWHLWCPLWVGLEILREAYSQMWNEDTDQDL